MVLSNRLGLRCRILQGSHIAVEVVQFRRWQALALQNILPEPPWSNLKQLVIHVSACGDRTEACQSYFKQGIQPALTKRSPVPRGTVA